MPSGCWAPKLLALAVYAAVDAHAVGVDFTLVAGGKVLADAGPTAAFQRLDAVSIRLALAAFHHVMPSTAGQRQQRAQQQ